MSRVTAWAVILVAAGLIYSLAFTTYELFSGSWETTDSGGLIEITVECPTPFSVLVFGEEPDGNRADEGFCVPSSRTLAVEAGFVAVAAGLLAWKPVSRRRPEPIQPISDRIDTRSTRTD